MPYFDHNATTPLAPAARDAWLRANDEHWHNPSSPYRDAARARLRLDSARERLAELLGTAADRIVFNSGATEGAHAVLADWARRFGPDAWIAVSAIEHPALLSAAERTFGSRVLVLGTDASGVVSRSEMERALRRDELAGLVLMAANNETGVIQPWSDAQALCAGARKEFLCDASQWLGKLPASQLGGVDWVLGAAHKFGGPKGVGFIKIHPSGDGFSAQPGGGQEHGHRGGTENVPGAWALCVALAEAEQRKVFLERERLLWRQEFEREICASLAGTRVIGAASDRLWNTVSLLLPAGENQRWVTRLDRRGFQVSTGSACATGQSGPSHVLSAMGLAPEEAKRVIRVSSGWETSHEDWRALISALVEVGTEVTPAPGVVKL